jgi:hypothetical protein
MPKLLETFATGLLLRRLLASQEKTEQHLRAIADSLQRLADSFAPVRVDTPVEDLRETGVSFSRDAEQARAMEFEAAIWHTLHRAPTEAEILDFLDGKMAGLDS